MVDIIEILGKIGFDWRMALFSLINFLVVFFLLSKFFFKKISETLQTRQAEIQKGLEDAEKAKYDLAMANQKYDELVGNAKVKANEIVNAAIIDAKDVSNKIKTETELEIENMRAQAEKNLAKERGRMIEDVRKSASNLVVSATEKLIGKEVENQSNVDDIVRNFQIEQ